MRRLFGGGAQSGAALKRVNTVMIMLYWSEKISRYCTYLLSNTRSTRIVKNHFPPMTVHGFGVDPSEIMTSRETQE